MRRRRYRPCAVLAPPRDLADADVAAVLRRAWSLPAGCRPTYAPVGFGSHHWVTDDYFVSVDEAADADELTAALRTAQALRDDAALPFVIAPIPADDGSLVVPVNDGWVAHLYERLEVVDDTTFGPHDD